MLNGTQKSVLDATILPMLDSLVEELTPKLAQIALEALSGGAVTDDDQRQLCETGMEDLIRQLQRIYQHPYVQNRSVGSPYVDQREGWVAYEPNGHGNGVVEEREGMLGLTALNDATAEHVTRADVLAYVDNAVQKRLQALRSAPAQPAAAPLPAAPAQPAVAPEPAPAAAPLPSAPPLSALGRAQRARVYSAESVNLYRQAVINFSDVLRGWLYGRDEYDAQAPNSFLGSILSALRRNEWDSLCLNPEYYSIPEELLGLIIDYVNEHPELKPSERLSARVRHLEGVVNASSPARLASSVAGDAAAAQPSRAGFYATHQHPAHAVDATPTELAQAVLSVYENIGATLTEFPDFDPRASGVYLASFLRAVRKGAIEDFYLDPENTAGVPKALIPFLKSQVEQYPALLSANVHSEICHQQIEKPLRADNVEDIRQFVAEHAPAPRLA